MQRLLLILMLAVFSVGSHNALAIEGENSGAATISIHDIAKKIRKIKTWQILDARSDNKAYRFKLINSNSGQVKIIHIDPEKPNLRRLKQ